MKRFALDSQNLRNGGETATVSFFDDFNKKQTIKLFRYVIISSFRNQYEILFINMKNKTILTILKRLI